MRVRIGELARRTGVSTRALRYYEEQNLLSAERSHSGQRHYEESAVDRIHLIRRLYAAGLSSRTIAELTSRVIDGKATPELLQRLATEREQLDRRIAELTRTRNRLDSVIGGATTHLRTGAPCPQDGNAQTGTRPVGKGSNDDGADRRPRNPVTPGSDDGSDPMRSDDG